MKFLAQASSSRYQLRAAVYEFTHAETLQAFAEAVERGCDVKIIRHCKGSYHSKVKRNSIVKDDNGKVITEWIPDETTDEAAKAINEVGFRSIDHAKTWHHDTFIERRHSSAIMHNKFIILLQDGMPSQVWTGSTNFTDGGIYGQSNVGHIVRDSTVAEKYLSYWNALSLDPPGRRRSGSHSFSSRSDDGIMQGTVSSNGEEELSKDEVEFGPTNYYEPLMFQSLESTEEEKSELEGPLNVKSSENKQEEPMDTVIENEQPDLEGALLSKSINVIFSPRKTTAMLNFYADCMSAATSNIFLTAPFGVCQEFAQVLNQSKMSRAGIDVASSSTTEDGLRRSPRLAKNVRIAVAQNRSLLRYVLFDKKPSEHLSKKYRDSATKKGKEYIDYFDFKEVKENRIAYGAVLSDDEDGLHEDLTGLTTFVDFVHLKCMLIDATTDNPTVITGSANFSEASTIKNDENMLVISGDCTVADIYLTEFMRLFNHFHSRDEYTKPKDPQKTKKKLLGWGKVAGDESWLVPYFDPENQLYHERLLFSSV